MNERKKAVPLTFNPFTGRSLNCRSAVQLADKQAAADAMEASSYRDSAAVIARHHSADCQGAALFRPGFHHRHQRPPTDRPTDPPHARPHQTTRTQTSDLTSLSPRMNTRRREGEYVAGKSTPGAVNGGEARTDDERGGGGVRERGREES